MLPRPPRRRAGVTLIELLVVIAIIAILAALLVGAISRAKDSAKDFQTRSDMSQMDTAISVFKNKLHIPPPSAGTLPAAGGDPTGMFRMCSQYATGSSGSWSFIAPFTSNSVEVVALARMFPNINFADTGLRRPRPDGTAVQTTDPDQGSFFIQANAASGTQAPVLLDPNQCLVVFMSGGEFTDYTGYSTDPAQPFKYRQTGSRLPGSPFFEFPRTRMKKPDDLLPQIYSSSPGCTIAGPDDNRRRYPMEDLTRYRHPWFVDNWDGGDVAGMPYLYLSGGPNGNAYATAEQLTVPFGLAWTAGEGSEPWFGVDTESGALPAPGIRGFQPFRTSQAKWANATTWQFVCAGKDGKFGPGSARTTATGVTPVQYRLFQPSIPPYSQGNVGGDDVANFHPRKLGSD